MERTVNHINELDAFIAELTALRNSPSAVDANDTTAEAMIFATTLGQITDLYMQKITKALKGNTLPLEVATPIAASMKDCFTMQAIREKWSR